MKKVSLIALGIVCMLISGCSTIHTAAFRGDIDAVKKCIQEGSNVDERGGETETPLMLAVANKGPAFAWSDPIKGDLNMARFLVDKGADVNAKATDGRTVLMYAIINWRRSPGYWIDQTNQLAIVQFLVAKGADINAKDHHGGETPLTYASRALNDECNIALIKFLVDKGADVNAGSPLLIASSRCNLELVKYLVGKGAYVNATGPGFFSGRTAIDIAGTGCVDCIFPSTCKVRKVLVEYLKQQGVKE